MDTCLSKHSPLTGATTPAHNAIKKL